SFNLASRRILVPSSTDWGTPLAMDFAPASDRFIPSTGGAYHIETYGFCRSIRRSRSALSAPVGNRRVHIVSAGCDPRNKPVLNSRQNVVGQGRKTDQPKDRELDA